MSEGGPARNNFTMLPNVILEMGLSSGAIALYVAIRRSAGDNGTCTRSASTLAENAGMSKASVHNAKTELVKAGLITLRDAPSGRRLPAHHIELVDIWQQNSDHFQVNNEPIRTTVDLLGQPADLIGLDLDHSKNLSKNQPKNPESKNIPYGEKPAQPPGNGKPKGKSRTRKTESTVSKAVAAYRHQCKLYPPGDWGEKVTQVVGELPADLEFWEQVINAWLGLGWSKANVKGMVECFERRELPGANRKGQPTGPRKLVVVKS